MKMRILAFFLVMKKTNLGKNSSSTDDDFDDKSNESQEEQN